MQIFSTIDEIRHAVQAERHRGKSIGFVATMGNLHDGHLSLVTQMQKHADIIITSIFVNPLQFGPTEDLDFYPKTLNTDLHKLENADNHYVFTPNGNEIYNNGKSSKTLVSVRYLDGILCGKSRPDHLTGVATVVAKLFNIITPDVAIFGLKDYQQYLVIKQMTSDLCLPVKIIGAPIFRDDNGLALSSRNGYLTDKQLKIAPRLNKILNIVKQNILRGEVNFRELEKQAFLILNDSDFRADYFEIRTQDNLKVATNIDKKLAIFVAAYLDETRLIDNIRFEII